MSAIRYGLIKSFFVLTCLFGFKANGQNAEQVKNHCKNLLLVYGKAYYTEKISKDSAVNYNSLVVDVGFENGLMKVVVNHKVHFKSVNGLTFLDFDEFLFYPLKSLAGAVIEGRQIRLNPSGKQLTRRKLNELNTFGRPKNTYEIYFKNSPTRHIPYTPKKKSKASLQHAFAELAKAY